MNPFDNKKEEVSVPVAAPKEEVQKDPVVLVSNMDAYVHDIMKSQKKTLHEVDIKVEEVRKANEHRLSLPEEIKIHEKKYAFRWVRKEKRSIDEHIIKGWTFVNRTLFQDLPKHFFTASGSMERGDLILAFIPQKKAQEIRAAGGIRSNEIIQGMKNRHGENPKFYNPEAADEKGKKEESIMI